MLSFSFHAADFPAAEPPIEHTEFLLSPVFVKARFFYERDLISKSFFPCENDVQLIGLLDRKWHHVIG